MKLSDEFDDNESKNKLPLIYMAIALITFFVFVVIVVIGMNEEKLPKKITPKPVEIQTEAETTPQDEYLASLGIGQSTLTSDQLDFWNMYKDDTSLLGQQISANTLTKDELYEKNAQKLLEEEMQKEMESDLSEGGTKTMVKHPDGTEQWIMINSFIPKNKYEDIGFIYDEPVMRYFQDGEKQSYLGAVINDDVGNVDFNELRRAGVEFVMLRVGYRGYESGELSTDNNYYDYFQDAINADLKVGVYFESQAINEDEAMQEAEFVISHLIEMNVTYPVAYKLSLVKNANSRVDNLTKMEASQIANRFCERISESGFKPLVFSDKYYLLRKLDLTLLNGYSIWLSQDGEKPDYPYEFTMWQYNNAAKFEGISNDIPLAISFVDYGKR